MEVMDDNGGQNELRTMYAEAYQVEEDKLETDSTEYIPILLCLPQMVGTKKPTRTFTALVDTGSSHTWIDRKALPLGVLISKVPALKSQTLAGHLSSAQAVMLSNTLLPEFS
jgi:hypothetical protein